MGAHLERIVELHRIGAVRVRLPVVLTAIRDKLSERVRSLVATVDPDRLEQEVEREVQRRRAVGDRADGDELGAGLGVRTDGLEVDPTGDLERHEPVAMATVVRTWRSAPRPAGASMLVGPDETPRATRRVAKSRWPYLPTARPSLPFVPPLPFAPPDMADGDRHRIGSIRGLRRAGQPKDLGDHGRDLRFVGAATAGDGADRDPRLRAGHGRLHHAVDAVAQHTTSAARTAASRSSTTSTPLPSSTRSRASSG